ncbi:hypothetical protein GGI11_004759 [Coemansia sp. RSA 2049]|nr:hypothetical protein GGI11_004759 [Coemansia sp. RSA 2049]KAJ2521069.1 hypothetical protein H4217_001634 [Coemansia sp. RSA 1939]KAJ2598378.1 hypothetical protein EV177_007540 [Coemansia sp. RSA 1804]
MAGTSLADLKKRQQQRRLQQKDKASTNGGGGSSQLKRKRESNKAQQSNSSTGNGANLDAYFARPAASALTKAQTAPPASSAPLDPFLPGSNRFLSTHSNSASTASALKRTVSVVGASGSPFAATPRDLKSNPFDIIEPEERLDKQQQWDSKTHFAQAGDSGVGSDSDSDSDSDKELPDYAWEAGNEYCAAGSDDDELGLNENDPSLYRLSLSTPTPKSTPSAPHAGLAAAVNGAASHSPLLRLGNRFGRSATSSGATEDISMQIDSTTADAKVNRTYSASSIPPPKQAVNDRQPQQSGILQESSNKKQADTLAFSKPPESLSLRTHITITAEQPLEGLECLRDEAAFLAQTSLCSQQPLNTAGLPQSPLGRLADSLLYWEATSPELTSVASSSDASTTKSKQQQQQPSSSAAIGLMMMHQALASIFTLQRNAPASYPFVYMCAREFTVVFQMVARKVMSRHSDNSRRSSSTAEPDTLALDPHSERKKKQEYTHVAVVSQSHMGLRQALHGKGIGFTLPLAPKNSRNNQNWSELIDRDSLDAAQKNGENSDQFYLRTAAFDKTWRSAILVMGDADVSALFEYLRSGATTLHDLRVYSPAPFLNATMRCANLRFSDAVTYDDTADSNSSSSNIIIYKGEKEENRDKCRPQATRIYKLDIAGILFPSTWAAVLKSAAHILSSKTMTSDTGETDKAETTFCVSAKELADTAHLNLLVSRQGSSVAGKKTVKYRSASRKFMYN